MTRTKLIQALSQRFLHLTEEQAENAVLELIRAIIDALGRGERVEVRGFGSLDVKHQAPRRVRNPKSGKTWQQGSKYRVRFKAGKQLLERVNNPGLSYDHQSD